MGIKQWEWEWIPIVSVLHKIHIVIMHACESSAVQRQAIPVVVRWASFNSLMNDYVTAATYWLTATCVIHSLLRHKAAKNIKTAST